MNAKSRASWFLCALLTVAFVHPAQAGSPTYGASAAVMALDPISENYGCGTVTINGAPVASLVPKGRCYSGDMTASGFRRQGNGAPFGDSQVVAGTYAQLIIPAPENDSPTTGGYILWLGIVGGWGNLIGPGANRTGDNFVILHSPNTQQGRRGQQNTLTLMNDEPRPQDGGFWVAGGFHHDTSYGKWVIPAVATYPTGNETTLTDVVFKVGESANGYGGYVWRDVVRFKFAPPNRTSGDYGVRWNYQGNHFVKDAANPSRWIGVVPWTNLKANGVRGSAPAMIDFSQAANPAVGIQLCLGFDNLDTNDVHVRPGFTAAYDFYCYREAEVATARTSRPINPATGVEALPARMVGDFVRSVARVTTSYGTHGEIWLSSYNQTPKWCTSNWQAAGYASENACALASNVCGGYLTDTTLYLNNRAGLLNGTTERPNYYELNLSTLWIVGGAKYLANDLVQWPSPMGDHGDTYLNVNRYEWGETLANGAQKEALYVGVKRSFCLEPYGWGNQRWLGVGSAFLNLLEK